MSSVVRRSAGGSGFPDTPAGTSAGVGPVGVGRAADCAGEHFPRAHGATTRHFSFLFDAEAARAKTAGFCTAFVWESVTN